MCFLIKEYKPKPSPLVRRLRLPNFQLCTFEFNLHLNIINGFLRRAMSPNDIIYGIYNSCYGSGTCVDSRIIYLFICLFL